MRFWNVQSGEIFETCLKAMEWDCSKPRILSFVGAGGKTTLIETLSREIAQLGYRVVITTTTHMQKPKQNCYEWSQMPDIRPGQVIYVGTECGNGKIKAPEELSFSMLKARADMILVEADGSKRKPLKVPAAHEPVIPKETEFVIGVLGYNSVGKRIEEISHRASDVARFLHKKPEETVTIEDLVKISFDREGLLKGVTCPYRIIWNRWKREPMKIEQKHSLILCEEI